MYRPGRICKLLTYLTRSPPSFAAEFQLGETLTRSPYLAIMYMPRRLTETRIWKSLMSQTQMLLQSWELPQAYLVLWRWRLQITWYMESRGMMVMGFTPSMLAEALFQSPAI